MNDFTPRTLGRSLPRSLSCRVFKKMCLSKNKMWFFPFPFLSFSLSFPFFSFPSFSFSFISRFSDYYYWSFLIKRLYQKKNKTTFCCGVKYKKSTTASETLVRLSFILPCLLLSSSLVLFAPCLLHPRVLPLPATLGSSPPGSG